MEPADTLTLLLVGVPLVLAWWMAVNIKPARARPRANPQQVADADATEVATRVGHRCVRGQRPAGGRVATIDVDNGGH